MEEHWLLRYAYDKYSVGSSIYSTSGNKTSHCLQAPYHIDECGSVQDDYGWLIYNITLDKWAEIKSNDDRVIRGEFEYENGKLSFICHTKDVCFKEVLKAITSLRDECQRQIDNQNKCPFY